MKRKFKFVLLGSFFLLFIAALEIAYRIFLYVAFPNNFEFSQRHSKTAVFDKPQWEYDSHVGYRYPHNTITTTVLQDGLVIECLVNTYVNSQGNIGPDVPDFNQAENRIAIFGDSFTAHTLYGEDWPSLLASRLNYVGGKKTRVMNFARDGYGVAQMFDLAAVEILKIKPTLVLFAFNSTAIARGRTWRVVIKNVNETRILSTIENSSVPDFENSTDIETLIPAANKEWCDAMLSKTDDQQRKDVLLNTALAQLLKIRKENDALLSNIWDLKSSYIYNFVVHGNPFYQQWHKISPSANPILQYDDFKNDPAFLRSFAVVQSSGIPFVFIHLPMGISIRDHQEFFLDEKGRSLKHSLEQVTGHKVIALQPYLSIKDEDGMKLCMKPNNCHPSLFGMQVYAEAIAKVLMPMLKQEKHR